MALTVGIGLLLLPTPEGLNDRAWQLFAVFLATITGIVLKILPMGATALLGLTACVFLGLFGEGSKQNVSVALGGFSNTVPWLAAFAFFIARGFIKTGLGRRIALHMIRRLGKSTLGLAYGLALADLILAPAMPSITARGGGIIYPVARAVSESFDSHPKKGSRFRIGAFLMLSAFSTNLITASMFMTAMAANVLVANLASKVGVELTWAKWALMASVPGLASLVLVPWVLHLIYPPETKRTPGARRFAVEQLELMGRMTRNEWIMLATFILLLSLWIGAKVLGVHTVAAAMLGISLLIVAGVLTYGDVLGERGAWDTLIWLSILILMGGQLSDAGFIDWFAKGVGGYFEGTPAWIAFVGLSAIYFYSHYLFASATAHIVAMYLPFLALGVTLGAPATAMAMLLAAFSNMFASITHYGIGPAPIFYGSGYVEIREWWSRGAVTGALNIAIWMILGTLWWKLLGYF